MRKASVCIGVLLLAGLCAPALAVDDHVVLYSGNEDTVNKLVVDGFKQATGITVDVVASGSGVAFRRIASEQSNPHGDVVWGVSETLLKQNSKYFQAYAVKGRDAVPAMYRDPNNLWIGTNIQVVTISQNTKSISAASGPRSWNDLLDTKWKGKIACADPANSGFTYAAVTGLLRAWGDNNAAWEKIRNLLANAKVLNRSFLVFDGNGSGEYPLGISLEYAGYLWAHNGAPVQIIYPADGTTVLAEGAAIIKGGPHQDAARKLMDYLASKSTQEKLLKATFRRPARQDIDLTSLPGHMKPLSEIKVLSYDDLKWNRSRKETLDRLQTIIQDTR